VVVDIVNGVWWRESDCADQLLRNLAGSAWFPDVSPALSARAYLAEDIKRDQAGGHRRREDQDVAIQIDPLPLSSVEAEGREQSLHGKSAHRDPRAYMMTQPAKAGLTQLKAMT
jgi:hypothetical protein